MKRRKFLALIGLAPVVAMMPKFICETKKHPDVPVAIDNFRKPDVFRLTLPDEGKQIIFYNFYYGKHYK
jgi:hypothetical protein